MLMPATVKALLHCIHTDLGYGLIDISLQLFRNTTDTNVKEPAYDHPDSLVLAKTSCHQVLHLIPCDLPNCSLVGQFDVLNICLQNWDCTLHSLVTQNKTPAFKMPLCINSITYHFPPGYYLSAGGDGP